MEGQPKLKVLCVDDEPHVIAGLALHLRRRYEPLQATSGDAGLEMLHKHPSIAIIVSDMRMPGMDGATFLGLARKAAPEAVRVLLTGQADIDSAMAAVNHGQIFRFLTKPCPPPALMVAMDSAAEHHRLLTAERVLLEETLRGSLKAVTDVLALTSPLAFGCAMRVKEHVTALTKQLGWPYWWQVDVAAMLCQLGSISLPASIAEKYYYGKELDEDEAAMVARIPALTKQLLASIPRLEIVLELLSRTTATLHAGQPDESEAPGSDADIIRKGGELLRAAIDFDALETRGLTAVYTLETMRGRKAQYDPTILNAFLAIRGGDQREIEIRELPLASVSVGMVLADELRTPDGMLLSARGLPVTAGLVARVRNDRRVANQRVRVVISNNEEQREAS